jgi:hypothetical protein
MKKLMIAAGAAAVFATFSFGALAEDATGAIQSVDANAGLVTLDDGRVFKMSTAVGAVALATFKSGQKVTIKFDGQAQGVHFTKDDPAPATAIVPVPAAAEGATTPAPGAAPY